MSAQERLTCRNHETIQSHLGTRIASRKARGFTVLCKTQYSSAYMSHRSAFFVLPGEVTGNSEELAYNASSVFYKWDLELRSLYAGVLTCSEQCATSAKAAQRLATVQCDLENPRGDQKASALIPRPGKRVIAVVLRVNRRQATALILHVGTVPAKSEFIGVVRQQDIQEDNWDSVRVYDHLQPGDLIAAVVLSDLEQKHYYLRVASMPFLIRR